MTPDALHGHIKLSRKQMAGNDLLWDDGTPFDSRSAWTHLLFLAAWRPFDYRIGTDFVRLERGEFVASSRFLAERWQWSKDTVARFLKMLIRVGRLAHQPARHDSRRMGSLYLIVNYDRYQATQSKSATRDETPNATRTRHERAKREAGKASKAVTTSSFDAVWAAYPKRAGHSRQAAFKAWHARIREGVDPEALLAGVRAYAAYVERERKEPRYVKHASTFLGPDRHWEADWGKPLAGELPDGSIEPYMADGLTPTPAFLRLLEKAS